MNLVLLIRNPFGLYLYFSYGDKLLLIECIRMRSNAVSLANFVGNTRKLLVCKKCHVFYFRCIGIILKPTYSGSVDTVLLLEAKTEKEEYVYRQTRCRNSCD